MPLPFLDVSRKDWIIRLWRTSCEIRVTLVGVFSIGYLVQAGSSGMQFMNVTLFKQSPLSNTAKHIASNQSGEKTRSAEQRTKKFKPYMWGWVRNLMCRIYVHRRAMICFVPATWHTWLFGARHFLYCATTFRVTIDKYDGLKFSKFHKVLNLEMWSKSWTENEYW